MIDEENKCIDGYKIKYTPSPKYTLPSILDGTIRVMIKIQGTYYEFRPAFDCFPWMLEDIDKNYDILIQRYESGSFKTYKTGNLTKQKSEGN